VYDRSACDVTFATTRVCARQDIAE